MEYIDNCRFSNNYKPPLQKVLKTSKYCSKVQNFHKRHPTYAQFQTFATSILLGYISELRHLSVWKRCHNLCFGSISWCNSHITRPP